MNESNKPVIIQKEKLASVDKSRRITKAEIIESAKRAEKKVLQETETEKPTKFIEME
ncbi:MULTISPECIES: hypothetical protein [unclassified Microbulbifer]|uniref:hypothetical protein n=1 Tax=unclassified Microbulbifer TaxID=2619833 RepID=UPI0027E5B08A|nr:MULTISPECIES: hypothetical protein [unclassified Microbulbifer]